ncbi:MAG: Ig domain-containing protein [Thermodesulfobacteriota bacterium]
MTNFSKYLIIAALVLLSGCNRNSGNEQPVRKEASTEATQEPVTESESGPEADIETAENALPTLSDIKSIKVLAHSDNPRDGFRVEIEYGKHEPESMGYLYEWKVNGQSIPGANENELDWQDGFKKGDEITVSVTPYNSLGQGTSSAEGRFRIPNSPPVITSEPDTSFQDGKFSYAVVAEDPDGDPLDYSLKNAPRGMTIEPATGLIVWEYGEKDEGEYKVTVIVTDSDGARAVQELTLSIHPQGRASEEKR